jgi:hypothetical protein
MKKLTSILLVIVLTFALSGVALAGTGSDSSSVTITFSEIAELGVSGNPGTLTIAAPATAGDLPADQSDATTTMSWTSNTDYVGEAQQTRKITGSLAVLFSGIDLYGTVAAPGTTDGASAGELRFTAAATAYEFVTGIENCNVSAQMITFRANVTGMVTPYTSTAQTITWTLTEDA